VRARVVLWLVVTAYLAGVATHYAYLAAGPRQDAAQRDAVTVAVIRLAVAVLALVCVQLPWAVHLTRGWRASRAAPRRHQAELLARGDMAGRIVASVWVRVENTLQQVYWEPWLDSLPAGPITVSARGKQRLVIDVDGFGRLWPAGATRREVPGLRLLRFTAARTASPPAVFLGLLAAPMTVVSVANGPLLAGCVVATAVSIVAFIRSPLLGRRLA
jgi:hypothetical protein